MESTLAFSICSIIGEDMREDNKGWRRTWELVHICECMSLCVTQKSNWPDKINLPSLVSTVCPVCVLFPFVLIPLLCFFLPSPVFLPPISVIPCFQIFPSSQNCFLFLSHFFHLSIHLKSWAPSSGTSCHLSFRAPLFPSIHSLILSWSPSFLFHTFNPSPNLFPLLLSFLSNSGKSCWTFLLSFPQY